jgi:hypothetical protein
MSRTFFVLLLFSVSVTAGTWIETINAFIDRPKYGQPIATSLGSLTNSGWYMSGSIDREFGFSVSLPVTLVYLNSRDLAYNETLINENCVTCREKEAAGADVACRGCVECLEFTAPTLFGDTLRPVPFTSIIDSNFNVTGREAVLPPYEPGIKELYGISVLPFVSLQLSFSYYYTELKLRYSGSLVPISDNSFHFPGVGIQHDFSRLIPALPLSLSLAANFTWPVSSVTPGGDVEGSLSTTGLSNFLGIVTGYKISGFFEAFLEAGWDHSFIHLSGDIVSTERGARETAVIDRKITGRNGFRAALNLAFSLGYHPVLGGVGGAQFGNLINIISYKSRKKE